MNSRMLKGRGRTFLPYLIPIVCYLAGSRLQLNGRDFAFIVLTLNYGGMSFGYSFGPKFSLRSPASCLRNSGEQARFIVIESVQLHSE